MKKTIALLFFLVVLISCQDSVLQKPGNLISENKMVDILTDIAILQSIKVENPSSLSERNIEADKYIYKKYKIDSLQFSNSDKYYASDADKYLKMYEKVSQRIVQKKTEIDSLIAKGINVGTPKPHKAEVIKGRIMPLRRFFNK